MDTVRFWRRSLKALHELAALGLGGNLGDPVAAFATVLRRLKAGGEVIVPVFDRYADVSRGSARVVPPEARIIVAEGNYLLLREAPWDRLQDLWDMTAFIDVPLAELERRLIARWHHHGLSDEDARRRAYDNDIPNARRVTDGSRDADIVIHQDDLAGPAAPDHPPA